MNNKICICSIATPDMEELTKMTWPNKEEYCKKNNYAGILQTQTTQYLGFDKIHLIDGLLDTEKYEWILWLDNDTLITNFNKKIEEIIDENYHFIITYDYAQLNAGVFLVRNSPQGKAYIKHLKQKMYELAPKNPWLFGEEQYALVNTYKDEEFKDIIKIISQKIMNAYPYTDVYGHKDGYLDLFGVNGNWEQGDFIIHIPGFGPDLYHKRLDHFRKYIQFVVR